jgi:hypothetical protein
MRGLIGKKTVGLGCLRIRPFNSDRKAHLWVYRIGIDFDYINIQKT